MAFHVFRDQEVSSTGALQDRKSKRPMMSNEKRDGISVHLVQVIQIFSLALFARRTEAGIALSFGERKSSKGSMR